MYGIETIVKLNRHFDAGTTLDDVYVEGEQEEQTNGWLSENTTAVTGENNGA